MVLDRCVTVKYRHVNRRWETMQEDEGNAARGCLFGLLFSLPVWVGLVIAVLAVTGRCS